MTNFNEIYNTFFTEILHFVLKTVWNKQEAEEVTQDVFCKVFKNLYKFDSDKANFRTWIYNIAKNAAIDHIRKVKLETQSINDFQDSEGNVFVQGVDNREADRNLLAQELSNQINGEIDKLSDTVKQVTKMRFVDQLKMTEIANELDMPVSTVKVYVMRGRKELHESLKKHVG